MHQRFGRPAQQKYQDRWGGGLILATVLALGLAWVAGKYIGNWINGRGLADMDTKPGTHQAAVAAVPGDFQLRFVQVGAFRSKTNYMTAVQDMNQVGLSPVVGATKNNLTPVYVGPFANDEAAEAAKAKVQALKKDYGQATLRRMSVKYDPEAVPAATGMMQTDMKKGLDLLNGYLQEVAAWMENPAANDISALAESGKGLADLAAALSDSKDVQVKELAGMASTAGANAVAIEGLAMASPADAEYQVAMNQYMTLLDQYMTFKPGK